MQAEWIRQLRREASGHGMCKENRDALDSIQSKGEAIALYKKTIDWALEEGYPNFGTIQRDFADCGEFGVFVNRDFHGELFTDEQVYVFHHCSGWIRTGINVQKRIIPMMYFANGCNMTIKPIGKNVVPVRVPLYVFGENMVRAKDSEDVVFKHYKLEAK